MTNTVLFLALCLLTVAVPVAAALALAVIINKAYESITMRGHVK